MASSRFPRSGFFFFVLAYILVTVRGSEVDYLEPAPLIQGLDSHKKSDHGSLGESVARHEENIDINEHTVVPVEPALPVDPVAPVAPAEPVEHVEAVAPIDPVDVGSISVDTASDPVPRSEEESKRDEALLSKVTDTCSAACSVTAQSRRLKETVQERDRLKKESEKHSQEKLNLQAKVDKLKNNVAGKEVKLKDSEQELKRLRKELKSMKEESRKNELEASKAKKLSDGLSDNNTKLTADMKSCTEELEEKKVRLKNLEAEKHGVQDVNKKLNVDLVKCQDRLVQEELVETFSATLEHIHGEISVQISKMNRTQEHKEKKLKERLNEEKTKTIDKLNREREEKDKEEAYKTKEKEENAEKPTDRDSSKSSKAEDITGKRRTRKVGYFDAALSPFRAAATLLYEHIVIFALLGFLWNFLFGRKLDYIKRKLYLWVFPETIRDINRFEQDLATTPSRLVATPRPGSRRDRALHQHLPRNAVQSPTMRHRFQ